MRPRYSHPILLRIAKRRGGQTHLQEQALGTEVLKRAIVAIATLRAKLR